MDIKALAERLKPKFIEDFNGKPFKPCRVFVSASDMHSRALVRHASDTDPDAAFDKAVEQLSNALGSTDPTILRADWIINADSMTWEQLLKTVGQTRRNFFRRGVALSPDFSIAFTECELNANLIFYEDNKDVGSFNANRADVYCRTRFNCEFPALQPSSDVVVFDTNGVFVIEGEEPQSITGMGVNAGHRLGSPVDPKFIMQLMKSGAYYLAQSMINEGEATGRFIYGWRPHSNNPITAYSTAQHFGAISAMLDLYEVDGRKDKVIRQAVINGINYGIKTFVRWRQMVDGTQVAYLEDLNSKDLRLGSSGMALIALTKFTRLLGTPKYMPLMNAIAHGISSMQNFDGAFVHVLAAGNFAVKSYSASVDYDGQAALGLLKLYELTREEKLLDCAGRAVDRFVNAEYWKYHNHWVERAANELTIHRPKREYFELGINQFIDQLPIVYRRERQSPMLMSLMMSARSMLERMKSIPDMANLLAQVPMEDFNAALEARAANMLNGFFYPELAMFFTEPSKVVGSFFARPYAFRTRIDDIEDYINGFVGYLRYLDQRTEAPTPSAALLEGRRLPLIPSSAQQTVALKPVDESVLRIGLLRQSLGFWHPQSTSYALFYIAKNFNIEIFQFNIDDVNFEDKTINGTFLEGNRRVKRITPFPRIVDNSVLHGEDGRKMLELEKDCFLIRHDLNLTKQKVYDMLLKDGRFAEFLIQSHTIDSTDQFYELLDRYHGDVIMKPLRGARGIGVVRINRQGSSYMLNFNNQTVNLKADEFERFYNENLTRRKHILQPYIVSRTRSGNPFDVRVHCRRGAGGRFKVSPFPRIGNAAGVVSNIATGGYSMKYEVFLKQEFGDDWKKVYDTLERFGAEFPEYYQSFHQTTLFDVGVDMGIQHRGSDYDFKIFEVNTYIDGPFFEIEDAITHIEYYRYIDGLLSGK